jgi:ferredoxin-NADP reductase
MFTEKRPLDGLIRAAIDALATPHSPDGYLESLRRSWALDQPRATLERVTHLTRHSVTLHLRPNRCWTGFTAGQHVALSVEIDGVRHTRCYSLAGSAIAPGELELTIERHPAGTVSRWLFANARPGNVFDLSLAQGDFVLPHPRPEHVLLISGGSGITPVLSMLRTLCDEGSTRPVTFLAYAATPADMPYARELEELASRHRNVRLMRVFHEAPEAGDLSGRFDERQLAAAEPEFARAEAFVCGPERLLEAVRRVYDTLGLNERLHEESYQPPRYRVHATADGGRVVCERSGLSFPNDGRTLLEQAQSAGLEPEHGCRRGICHTCIRRMSAGTVRHVVTGDTFTATDVDIQLCVHAPAGDVRIDL